jgi:YidC/Oxa1 family membrane protein insertase
MDRTAVIVIVICLGLFGLWTIVLVPKYWPPRPLPAAATNATPASVASTNVESPEPAPSATNTPPVSPQLLVNTNVPEHELVVSNMNARYTFTSRGGGLKLVELLQYPETVSRRRASAPMAQAVATLNNFAPVPTLAVLGGSSFQGDGNFTLTATNDVVRAEKTLTNGLTMVKQFRINTNYLVEVTVRLENHSGQALALPAQRWVVGTATPMGPRDNGQMVGVLWYNGTGTEDINAGWFSGGALGCVRSGPPRTEYTGGASNVVWTAVHNQFFALAVMPQQPAQGIVARKIELPRPTGEAALLVATNAPAPQGYETALVYPALTLAADQAMERDLNLFAGPKEYRTLARIADRFGNNIDLVMGYGGFFGFFAKALLLAMNWLHQSLKFSYGWAIVVITFIIKVVFWPLTQASTRSMKRMQALQPQMKAIQEKYKDDPVKMNKKVMEFMKEHKVSPLGGCLPMVLQIPVFFGFYRMIQSAIELRGARFLWVGDLSQPDTLLVIPGLSFIPFIGIPGVGLPINLLPLIMGVTMLWQARLTPPSPGMDPAQAKIMRYMPLMFMVFLYNFSAGLTLYWTVQNLLTIAQTKLTRNIAETPPTGKGPVLTTPQKKKK